MKSSKVVRTRNFSATTYLSREEIEEYVSHPNIVNYAYIPHNKDVYDEDVKDNDGNIVHEKGSLKKPHFHLVVTFANARTLSAVKNDFLGYSQNTFVELVKDMESALAYLTHKNAPDKYQYSVDIVCSNYGYFRGDFSSSTIEDNTAFRIINDMEMGYSHYALVRKYGRDYVVNYKRYKDMQNLCFGREIDCDKIYLEQQVSVMQDELNYMKIAYEKLKRDCCDLQKQNTLYEKTLCHSRSKVMMAGKKNVYVFDTDVKDDSPF